MKETKIFLGSIEKVKDFVNEVSRLDCDVDIVSGRYVIDAKSIMGLLSLGIPKEIFIVIHTNNKDVISKFEEDISKWKVEE